MNLNFHKYGNVYQIRVYCNDGTIYSCTTTNLDNIILWWFDIFDDTYTITHEFMQKYEQYRKGETV